MLHCPARHTVEISFNTRHQGVYFAIVSTSSKELTYCSGYPIFCRLVESGKSKVARPDDPDVERPHNEWDRVKISHSKRNPYYCAAEKDHGEDLKRKHQPGEEQSPNHPSDDQAGPVCWPLEY